MIWGFVQCVRYFSTVRFVFPWVELYVAYELTLRDVHSTFGPI